MLQFLRNTQFVSDGPLLCCNTWKIPDRQFPRSAPAEIPASEAQCQSGKETFQAAWLRHCDPGWLYQSAME